MKRGPFVVRLPLEPLLPWLDWSMRRHGRDDGVNGHASEVHELAGYDRNTFIRWRRDGGLPISAADTMATVLGQHPSRVWGDEWLDALNAERVERERREWLRRCRRGLHVAYVWQRRADALAESWALRGVQREGCAA